jgi:hypothetical protein
MVLRHGIFFAIITFMTPEEKTLLESTYKLAEENNKILVSMRRSNRLTMVMRITYWVLIIVLSFGAYYFIQPYFTMLSGAYGGVGTDTLDNAQNAANSLRDLLK